MEVEKFQELTKVVCLFFFANSLNNNPITYGVVLIGSQSREDQKDEFLGCTMTSHDFNIDMYGFYTSQSFQRVQDHPIRSSNEQDTTS